MLSGLETVAPDPPLLSLGHERLAKRLFPHKTGELQAPLHIGEPGRGILGASAGGDLPAETHDEPETVLVIREPCSLHHLLPVESGVLDDEPRQGSGHSRLQPLGLKRSQQHLGRIESAAPPKVGKPRVAEAAERLRELRGNWRKSRNERKGAGPGVLALLQNLLSRALLIATRQDASKRAGW